MLEQFLCYFFTTCDSDEHILHGCCYHTTYMCVVCRHGSVYVCGHLHTLGGLMPHMYSRQKTGYLELELADWKDQRM